MTMFTNKLKHCCLMMLFVAVMPVMPVVANAAQTIEPRPLAYEEVIQLEGEQSESAEEVFVGESDDGTVILAAIGVFFLVLLLLAAAAAP